jgi:hypothetical protein
METSSGRGRRAFLTTAGILLALAVVALAAGGRTATGEGGPRTPSDTLIDILLSFYVVALVAGAFLFVYLLALGRRMSGQNSAGRRDWRTWLGVIVIVGALTLLARDLEGRQFDLGGAVLPGDTPPATVDPQAGAQNEYEPEFAWIPVLVTVGLVGLAVAGLWWSGKARRRARGELRHGLAHELAVAVDISLDDLRAEPDPRRAVIAAYARLEAVLASHRLPRRPAEAPLEYLERILAEQQVSERAARDLTVLFERAKFSQHAVDPEMKARAIDALERVRDDLLAAEALAQAAREAAHA